MHLTDQANQAIEGMRIYETNCDVAIKIFQELFGRSDELVDEYLDILFSVTPVLSSSHVAALPKLYDQVQAYTNRLNGVGVPPGQYAVLLYRLLMRSLSDDLAKLRRQKIREVNTCNSSGSGTLN